MSKSRSARNIREIPHPGQSLPVIRLKTQGIPRPVNFTNNAYPKPISNAATILISKLRKRFFCSVFIVIYKQSGTLGVPRCFLVLSVDVACNPLVKSGNYPEAVDTASNKSE